MTDRDAGLEQFKVAQVLFFSGRYSEAEEICSKLIESNFELEHSLLLMAMIFFRTHRLDDAEIHFRKVLEVNPKNLDANNLMARILANRFEFESAIQFQQKVIEVEPGKAIGYLNLGRIYQTQQNFLEAIVTYEKAIECDPQCGPAYHGLAQALEYFGEDAAAELQFKRALETRRNSASTMIQLGKLYARQGKPHLAKDLLDRGQKLARENPLVMGQEFIDANETERAVAVYEDALLRSGKSPELLSQLGSGYQKLGKFDQAESALKESLALKPYPITYLELIRSRKQTVEDRIIDRVLGLLNDATLPPMETSYLHYAAGKYYDDVKNFESAAHHFTQANQIQYRLMGPIKIDMEACQMATNASIKAWTSESFDGYASKGNPSKLPILIVGMIRSGTTLTEQIISSHPDVAAGGELQFLSRRSAGVLTPEGLINENRVWETAPLYLAHLRQLGSGRLHTTDKMPQNFAHLGFFHAMFPKAKIVHCCREKRDVWVSIFNTFFPFPVNYGHHWDTIKAFYSEYEKLMIHWRKVIPSEQLFELNYEDLLTDRESVLRRLFEFLELNWDDSVMHHENRGRAILTPSNWQARQPIYTTSHDRWRNYEPFYPLD